jgi:hypothetical protein
VTARVKCYAELEDKTAREYSPQIQLLIVFSDDTFADAVGTVQQSGVAEKARPTRKTLPRQLTVILHLRFERKI